MILLFSFFRAKYDLAFKFHHLMQVLCWTKITVLKSDRLNWTQENWAGIFPDTWKIFSGKAQNQQY